jgi:hypothetical protein
MSMILDGTAGVTFPDSTLQPTSYLPTGSIIHFAGTTPPTGFLTCPTSLTNISRTTYAALFAAIGTTWGAGDGSTTFGLPWFAAGYTHTQANSNVGTATTGQVISHTHTFTGPPSSNGNASAGLTTGNLSNTTQTTAATGGTANLAAGTAVLMCVKY